MSSSSRRPLIIVCVVAIAVVVVVGVVVWHVTKEAYQSDDVSSQIGATTQDTTTTQAPTETPTQAPITEEELRRHPWKRLRLSRDILPVHYDIIMYPDFHGNGTMFYGNETIELNVTSPTQFIMIHVHTDFMNVTACHVQDNETLQEVPIEESFTYKPNEFYVIKTKQKMTKNVRVMLQFEGSLIKSIMGIYKSTYTQADETKYLVATKFEPTYARRAFPCFDEPNVKAEYTVTLVHRPQYFALSNMPEEKNVTRSDGLIATKFQRSVKMSTYLVIFVVCDFAHLEITSARNITVRVFATSDKIGQAKYVRAVANHSLYTYEDVFGVPYPLPKLDLIGIPDFVSGAMENWGLITFRESVFLYDENRAPLSSKERVASVTCHEIAHMWFGNIVTMDWWNDLWLNEGFASYMEYLCVASMEKEWEYEDEFLIYDTFRVMGTDALDSTHPIVVDVKNPDEVTSVFDAISYSKGAAVIRMLKTLMGKDKFFQGISTYLKNFVWGNAKTNDLWNILSEVDNDLDVKKVMETWTIQDGFPYVNISLTTAADGITTVGASQKRYLSDQETAYNVEKSPFGYKWYIPLDFKTATGKNEKKVMNMTGTQFTGDFGLGNGRKNSNWIKFNGDKIGFYRVLYPKDMWERFARYLSDTPSEEWTLGTADRADLLADAFSFAESGFLKYDVPLTLSSYLSNENKYVPWSVAVNYGMFYITDMMVETGEYRLWKKFLVEQVSPSIKKLGYNDAGSHIERRLRSVVLNQACKYQEASTLEQVKRIFRGWLDNGESPSVNIRPAVYACGMANFGTDTDWNNVWRMYLTESSPQEKELLIYALSQTRKPYLISELLDRARRADGIRTQDFFTVVSNVGTNVYGNRLAWDWAREHYSQFVKRFTLNDRNFGRMIYKLVRKYNTQFKLGEVKAFFEQYPDEGASARYRKMAIENIQKNINWMNKARLDVVQWLNDRYSKSPSS